jgi:hypothetical protein
MAGLDALDVLELIDMLIESEHAALLEKPCNAAADLLERLVQECETPTGHGDRCGPTAASGA